MTERKAPDSLVEPEGVNAESGAESRGTRPERADASGGGTPSKAEEQAPDIQEPTPGAVPDPPGDL